MEALLRAWKPCQVSSRGSCPTVSLRALLTQLGKSGEACAECSPRRLGQTPAEPRAVARTPGPPPLPRLASPALS